MTARDYMSKENVFMMTIVQLGYEEQKGTYPDVETHAF